MAKKDNNSNKENKHFFRDFKAEIKKVIWPTPKQLINNTVAIITMVLIVSAIVFVLDLGFDAANKYGLTNLQKAVQSNTSDNTTTSDSNESNNDETNSAESTDSSESIETTVDNSEDNTTE